MSMLFRVPSTRSLTFAAQVQIWSRSYDVAPPPVEPSSEFAPHNDHKCARAVAFSLPFPSRERAGRACGGAAWCRAAVVLAKLRLSL
eukprot:3544684-Pleurochrysis_carterae.AAC.1